jgi:hypothetical protein
VDYIAVNNFGDTRSGGIAGPMGLFIIVLLSIATVLLIRNMNKRLRRLPDSFEDPADAQRHAEIARLDADLNRSPAGPVSAATDKDRSASSATDSDTQVSAVDLPDGPDPADRRPGLA